MNSNSRIVITPRRWISHYLSQTTHQSNQESKIMALCKLGRLKEGLQALYSDPAPLPTSSSSYPSLLQLCIDSRAREEGLSLQNHILASGHSSDLQLSTKFIIFHCKFADLVSARKVFDEMPDRSVVSWTAMISGYSQNGNYEEALKLFTLMRRSSGVAANHFTYGSILRACTGMGCIRIGEQIQGCIQKTRFAENLFVQSALLDLHLKCGVIEEARCLFQRMEERDAVSWNSVIGGYAVRGLGDASFELFCSMTRDGFIPDDFTFVSVLKACGSVKAVCNVNQVHAFITKLGFGNHYAVTGSLVDAYARCRRMCSARLVYDSMHGHDLISCTALINGYALERTASNGEAVDLFCELSRSGLQIDNIILCSMLNLCANIASLSLGRQIHAHVLKRRPNHGNDVALENALIDMYAKCGELDGARRAFDEMQCKNVISWTTLITSYGKHGYGKSAITLFANMEDGGVKPNDVTFLSLLFACSHSGLTAEGMKFFDLMVSKYGIHPRAEHYSCVVDLLARGGLLKEAYNFMRITDVKPNSSLWGSLLGASRIHGNASLGEVASGHLIGLDPEQSVNYVVLSNIYAAAGLWEDAWKMRKLMEERSVKKIAGYSSI